MKTKEIRLKLIEDDTKLTLPEGIFDTINNEETSSLISDEQYQKVEEARTEYLSGKSSTSSWDEVEKHLIAKYGL